MGSRFDSGWDKIHSCCDGSIDFIRWCSINFKSALPTKDGRLGEVTRGKKLFLTNDEKHSETKQTNCAKHCVCCP
jgi:hypothetical protein